MNQFPTRPVRRGRPRPRGRRAAPRRRARTRVSAADIIIPRVHIDSPADTTGVYTIQLYGTQQVGQQE